MPVFARRTARFVDHAFQSLEPRVLLTALPTALGVYRPSYNAVHIDYNLDRQTDAIRGWGIAGDIPVQADFNGDGITDIAMYRPTTAQWFVDLYQHAAADRVFIWGTGSNNATPLAGDVNGDGLADLALFINATGVWNFNTNRDGVTDSQTQFGLPGDIPLLFDWNRDGKADLVIYRKGIWYVDTNRDGAADLIYGFGNFTNNDQPFFSDVNNDGNPDLGIFSDGIWQFDFNRDGKPETAFQFGAAGDIPLAGNYNTAGSIFVSTTGNDGANGSQTAPLRTIAKAIAVANPGNIIRIGPGTFAESTYLYAKNNLTFIGSNALGTKISPASGDAFTLDRCTNLDFEDMNINATNTTNGRGIAALGTSFSLRGISTIGTRTHGVVTTDYLGVNTTLTAAESHFDEVQTGNAMYIQNGTTATFAYCSFDRNGTDSGNIPGGGADGGRGLVILGNSTVTVTNSTMNFNINGGAFMRNTSTTVMQNCALGYNVKGNGAIVLDQTKVTILQNLFIQNGVTRSAAAGLNGLEVYENFTGTALIQGNTFKDNTAGGLQLNGHTITVIGNVFDNNLIGVAVNGVYVPPITSTSYPGQTAIVTLKRNRFIVPVGSTVETGLFVLGSAATVTVGSTDPADANTFTNFYDYRAIAPDNHGGGVSTDWGYPTMHIYTNNYVNSPNPIAPFPG